VVPRSVNLGLVNHPRFDRDHNCGRISSQPSSSIPITMKTTTKGPSADTSLAAANMRLRSGHRTRPLRRAYRWPPLAPQSPQYGILLRSTEPTSTRVVTRIGYQHKWSTHILASLFTEPEDLWPGCLDAIHQENHRRERTTGMGFRIQNRARL
jgi:hypothetical protein